MGRPPGRIQDRLFQMRLSNNFLERLDKWRQRQPDLPSRAESIRRLTTAMLRILGKGHDNKSAEQKKWKLDLGRGSRPQSGILIQNILTRSANQVNKNHINPESDMTTTRQMKAARSLLGWSQSDLALHSGVSVPTIARLESAGDQLGGRGETVRKIQAALELAGIEFIEENGTGEGVRFRKPHRSRKK
jgi:ribosome-binding protein aMBF1 (putative translation factor)